jgi:hypothetical protein
MAFKWMILLLPLVTTPVFAADVYVCEKNGRKEFSQLPCGDNAVVLQTEGEPSSLKLSIPFKPKQITALCKLVIKAKDRSVQSQKEPSHSSSYNYNRNYNYNSQAYRYQQMQQQQRHYDNSSRRTPESYVLGKIENLEVNRAKFSTDLSIFKKFDRLCTLQRLRGVPHLRGRACGSIV